MLVLTGHTLKDADYTIDFHRGTLLTDEEKSGREAEIDSAAAECDDRGCNAGGGAGRAEGQSGMSSKTIDQEKQGGLGLRLPSGVLRLRLPATSANLGPGFDAVAVALDFYLEIEAEAAQEFSIAATGRNADRCARLEDNLILETYKQILRSQSGRLCRWRFAWSTGFRWAWVAARRRPRALRRSRWRCISASLAGAPIAFWKRLTALEGHRRQCRGLLAGRIRDALCARERACMWREWILRGTGAPCCVSRRTAVHQQSPRRAAAELSA